MSEDLRLQTELRYKLSVSGTSVGQPSWEGGEDKSSSDTIPGGFPTASACSVSMPRKASSDNFDTYSTDVAFVLFQHSWMGRQQRDSSEPLRNTHTLPGAWSAGVCWGYCRQAPQVRNPGMMIEFGVLPGQPEHTLICCLSTCCSTLLPGCSERMATVLALYFLQKMQWLFLVKTKEKNSELNPVRT